MRAAVARGREQLAVDERPVPEPGPGEVRVRLRACGICGTDLHFWRAGLWPPGTTPGHEMSGAVDVLGADVADWRPGDAVAVEPLDSCGACPSCSVGRDATCRDARVFGIHRAGGMAEYVCVPARRLFAVPADLEPRLAALAEPMAVVVHGLRRAGLEPGQRVLVLGAGSIGLLAVVAARALGAGEVWLSARHPHQARVGERLGAVRVLAEDETPPECADLVLETVGGSADTLIRAGTAVRRGGVISVVGVFMGQVTIEALPLFLKENTLAWSNCYVHPREGADFGTAVDLVSRERAALADVASHGIPLDEIDRAFRVASDKRAGAIKVTVLLEAP
jgi:threonine dehydrogenase-like Zn-dependent dehydrogenase